MELNKNLLMPDTVIHCPQEWQAQILINTIGWYNNSPHLCWDVHSTNTCYRINDNGKIGSYGNYCYFLKSYHITNFDDLLIKPTPSLSAKEFFQIHEEICDSTDRCTDCILKSACLDDWPHTNIEEMLKKCAGYRNKVTVELNLSIPAEKEIYEKIKEIKHDI